MDKILRKMARIPGGLYVILYFAIIFVAMIAMGIDEFTEFFVVFSIIYLPLMVVIGIYATKLWKKDEIEAEILKGKIDEIANFDAGKLTLKKRDPILASEFTITSHINVTVSHKPETIHYGSVTVGGITTGGVYKTGGYNYISHSEKSGRYILNYRNEMVSTIYLTPELLEEAKNSPISCFLDEYKSCIEVILPWCPSEIEYRIAVTKMKTLGTLGNHPELYPTHDKCIEICNWITKK